MHLINSKQMLVEACAPVVGERSAPAPGRGAAFSVVRALTAAALCAISAVANAASIGTYAVDGGGLGREYLLASPVVVSAPGPRPLILLLHGHLGTAANAFGRGRMPSPLSAWLDIVDREQVLVAAMQGEKGSDKNTGWHDCRLDATGNPQVDDVTFAERVVQQLVQSGRADPKRIYVMGMSNGGMMAYRLALQMRPAPVAIAAVSSSMARNTACPTNGSVPKVSVLLIDGTADPIVPYAGGSVGLFGRSTGNVIGAEATRDFWLRNNGLGSAPVTATRLPHLSSSDSTSATRYVYGPKQGPQVELISIQGGGHIEPSLRYHAGWLYNRLVGSQNQDFESAEAAWAFFKDKTAP